MSLEWFGFSMSYEMAIGSRIFGGGQHHEERASLLSLLSRRHARIRTTVVQKFF
jgi:hypothetical protein